MFKQTKKPITDVLRGVAPGTAFRAGLENVLAAKTGALIVVGYDERVRQIVDGGFPLDCAFSPAYLYELAKMDGAIILDAEAKRIVCANAQLVPHSSIPSTETGIRHRTAQRAAKQTGGLVVSISQRRSVITLYKGIFHYALHDLGVVLSKANQAIQTLEKYTSVLQRDLLRLTALELEDLVTLNEIAIVLQRVEMALRVKQEIEIHISELGVEGRLISMQLEELVAGVEEEAYLLIQDYGTPSYQNDPHTTLDRLHKLSEEELLERRSVIASLGIETQANLHEQAAIPCGYRLLSKIPRFPVHLAHKLIDVFGDLSSIMAADCVELSSVEEVGSLRARAVKEGLRRIQEQVSLD